MLRLTGRVQVHRAHVRFMSAMITKEDQYINGQWVKSTSVGKYLEVTDSATEKVFAKVPDGSVEDMTKAIAAAKAAFPVWSQTSLDERKAAIVRISEKWQAKKPAVVEGLMRELGCTKQFAETHQLGSLDGHLSLTPICVDSIEFEEKYPMGGVGVKQPIGVVGCITPWNYPLNQIGCKILPAMIAGCTTVLKPSEITPLCAYYFAEAIHEAGLPDGVFNMVLGSGVPCSESLCTSPDVDLISFTGSTRAGKRITQVCADTVKSVKLELGGKSAALLLDDAKFEEWIPQFMAQSTANSGQSCNALSRMLVPKERYDEAVGIAKATAESFKVGLPSDPDAFNGAVSSKQQWDQIQSYIHKGLEEGARLVAGGPGRPEGLTEGYFVRPTVFADVNNNMAIAREEIFGPVLCLIPYGTQEEGIQIANDTIYGLNNAVASADKDRAVAVARQLHSGMVMVNTINMDPFAPFGGMKQSGTAREWGKHGIEEFLLHKSMYIELPPPSR